MCETKIEKAAKEAGATSAEWNKDTKIITVKYKSTQSNLAKIQKSIADVGYDNVGVKATTNHMTNCIAVASMKELEQRRLQRRCMHWNHHAKEIAVKMANAPKKDMMAKIAAQKMVKWIAAKMANAPRKAMMAKTAAKMRKAIINHLISHS